MKPNFWLGFGAGATVSIGLIVGLLFLDAGQLTLRLKNTGDETLKSVVINDVQLGDIPPSESRTASLADAAFIGINHLDNGKWISSHLHLYGKYELLLMTSGDDWPKEISVCPKPLSYLLGNF